MISLSFTLTLLTTLLTNKSSVRAHFLFTELNDDEEGVKVFFSEPVAMEGDIIKYMAERINHLTMIAPSFKSNGITQTIPLKLDEAGGGFLTGELPSPLENTPYLITGFLDYGDFGEDDSQPKVDLQYTFSSQISSTNPSDDWAHFFHYVAGTDETSPYGADTDGDPFAIALNSYGPPTRVVVRGVSADTPVHVCIYEGNGSNREVGCVEGTHNRTHHLTFDAEELGVLHPCETYFALANTTGVDEVSGQGRSLWASTSVTWNGPCRGDGVAPKTPVPQWYEPVHFKRGGGGSGGCVHSSTAATESAADESSIFPYLDTSSTLTVSLLSCTGGFLVGMLLYHILMRYVTCCQKLNHHSQFKVVSTDEKTVDYRDQDDASSTEIL